MLNPLPRSRAYPATARSVQLPAPVGGINTIASGAAMPPSDCISLWNMIASEYGLRARLGSREWVTGIDSANVVRTLMAFKGSTGSGSKDRVFAVTSSGIYNATASTATPTQVLAFTSPTAATAGYGISHAFVTAAGHHLLYCDEDQGYHVYTESSDTWAKIASGGGGTQISGVDPANLRFVTSWKSRLWFTEKDTASAWYMAAGTIYGAATKLDIGKAAQMRNGGDLVGLWNWTVDGGAGIDDNLVVLARGGDLAIYQGTDPADASTFSLTGVWNIGGLPAGRDIATRFGGDLLIMSTSGIRPLSQLIRGADGQQTYATEKVANLFNSLMLTASSYRGWAMHQHPEDNALVVLVPTGTDKPAEPLVMSLWNRGWSRYRDLPATCAAVLNGKFYFGTADGRVLINDGYVDGVTLADPNSYRPVQWALLSSFQNLGAPNNKRVQLIRPKFLTSGATPNFSTQARYDYDLSDLAPVSGATATGSNLWGTGTWDSAVWSGDFNASRPLRGGVGIGTDIAIAMRGESTSRTVLVATDVTFDVGGLL